VVLSVVFGLAVQQPNSSHTANTVFHGLRERRGLVPWVSDLLSLCALHIGRFLKDVDACSLLDTVKGVPILLAPAAS
jgi:hypothetical protein